MRPRKRIHSFESGSKTRKFQRRRFFVSSWKISADLEQPNSARPVRPSGFFTRPVAGWSGGGSGNIPRSTAMRIVGRYSSGILIQTPPRRVRPSGRPWKARVGGKDGSQRGSLFLKLVKSRAHPRVTLLFRSAEVGQPAIVFKFNEVIFGGAPQVQKLLLLSQPNAGCLMSSRQSEKDCSFQDKFCADTHGLARRLTRTGSKASRRLK